MARSTNFDFLLKRCIDLWAKRNWVDAMQHQRLAIQHAISALITTNWRVHWIRFSMLFTIETTPVQLSSGIRCWMFRPTGNDYFPLKKEHRTNWYWYFDNINTIYLYHSYFINIFWRYFWQNITSFRFIR